MSWKLHREKNICLIIYEVGIGLRNFYKRVETVAGTLSGNFPINCRIDETHCEVFTSATIRDEKTSLKTLDRLQQWAWQLRKIWPELKYSDTSEPPLEFLPVVPDMSLVRGSYNISKNRLIVTRKIPKELDPVAFWNVTATCSLECGYIVTHILIEDSKGDYTEIVKKLNDMIDLFIEKSV